MLISGRNYDKDAMLATGWPMPWTTEHSRLAGAGGVAAMDYVQRGQHAFDVDRGARRAHFRWQRGRPQDQSP
eukprot:14508839-Heterocapsa_arctica.AAC.1